MELQQVCGVLLKSTFNISNLFITALDIQDYTGGEQTLTFSPGQNFSSVTIPIRADNIDELTERFTVQLFNPQGASVGSSDTATVNIKDNNGK